MQTPADRSFAELLQQYRRAAGLTQVELAELAHLSASTVSDLERGIAVPYARTLTLLADALHLSAHERKLFTAARRVAPGAVAPPPASMPSLSSFTRLIGREDEIADVARFIVQDHARLVTLTGLAGIGKTRLALAVASELSPHFADGVSIVPLATLPTPDLIPKAIAQALHLRETGGQRLTDQIVAMLSGKAMLLLLDNFEHLLDSAGMVVDLLSACSQLVILVTSRAALRVRGELRFAVPPLRCAPANATTGEQQGTAEKLFITRAREVRPSLPLTPANLANIAAICRRLEGIPLAIELAAMRVATLTLSELLRLLDHRLTFLVQGPRDLPARQQTMRGAITWSYDLLSSSEQTALRRLAVFAGGWTVAAARAVCVAGDNEGELLQMLSALVDANLIQQEPEDDDQETHFVMLEILREYGKDLLEQHDELNETQRRHAEYMLALAEAVGPALKGPEQARWLRRLDREQGNLRAALHWAMEHDASLGLRIAAAIWWFWFVRRHLNEGRSWLETLIAQTKSGDALPAVRAQAHLGVSVLALTQGKYEHAADFAEISVTLFQEAGDRAGMCSAWSTLGNIARDDERFDDAETYYRRALIESQSLDDPIQTAVILNNLAALTGSQGRYGEAETLLQVSLAIKRAQGDPYGITASLNNLSNVAYEQGAYDRAAAYAEEALVYGKQSDSQKLIAMSLIGVGKAASGQGDFSKAVAALEQSRQIYEEMQNERDIATVFFYLGEVACAQREWQQAEQYYCTGIACWLRADYRVGIARGLAGWARVLLAQGSTAQAARYVSKAHALLKEKKVSLQASVSVRLAETKCAIQQALGEEAFHTAWEQGETLCVDDLLLSGNQKKC